MNEDKKEPKRDRRTLRTRLTDAIDDPNTSPTDRTLLLLKLADYDLEKEKLSSRLAPSKAEIQTLKRQITQLEADKAVQDGLLTTAQANLTTERDQRKQEYKADKDEITRLTEQLADPLAVATEQATAIANETIAGIQGKAKEALDAAKTRHEQDANNNKALRKALDALVQVIPENKRQVFGYAMFKVSKADVPEEFYKALGINLTQWLAFDAAMGNATSEKSRVWMLDNYHLHIDTPKGAFIYLALSSVKIDGFDFQPELDRRQREGDAKNKAYFTSNEYITREVERQMAIKEDYERGEKERREAEEKARVFDLGGPVIIP